MSRKLLLPGLTALDSVNFNHFTAPGVWESLMVVTPLPNVPASVAGGGATTVTVALVVTCAAPFAMLIGSVACPAGAPAGTAKFALQTPSPGVVSPLVPLS